MTDAERGTGEEAFSVLHHTGRRCALRRQAQNELMPMDDQAL